MGALFCLLSAVAFGAMAIFGKLAYDEGVAVGDLLLVRFALAAVALGALAAARGALRGVPRRMLAAGFAMGAVGYATQSGLFFLALERMDASLLALLLYTYPALVTAAAIALRRERATARRFAALGAATAGTALVLAGAGTGALDPLATVMGVGAAVCYSGYILVGDRVVGAVPAVGLTALVCAGATTTFATVAIIGGGPGLSISPAGLGWIAAIALVSTVGAILLFFAGLARVGPSAAAILSTLEPLVTVALAALAFGELLSAVQIAGGALVLAAVVVLQTGRPNQRSDSPLPISSSTSAPPANATVTSRLTGFDDNRVPILE
jgi:drug/metabolite transporter (DMT)-like permease